MAVHTRSQKIILSMVGAIAGLVIWWGGTADAEDWVRFPRFTGGGIDTYVISPVLPSLSGSKAIAVRYVPDRVVTADESVSAFFGCPTGCVIPVKSTEPFD